MQLPVCQTEEELLEAMKLAEVIVGEDFGVKTRLSVLNDLLPALLGILFALLYLSVRHHERIKRSSLALALLCLVVWEYSCLVVSEKWAGLLFRILAPRASMNLGDLRVWAMVTSLALLAVVAALVAVVVWRLVRLPFVDCYAITAIAAVLPQAVSLAVFLLYGLTDFVGFW